MSAAQDARATAAAFRAEADEWLYGPGQQPDYAAWSFKLVIEVDRLLAELDAASAPGGAQ